jgi:hypothetical protein
MMWTLRLISALFVSASVFVLLVLLEAIPYERSRLLPLMYPALVAFLFLGVLTLLASLGDEYFVLYENGIEMCSFRFFRFTERFLPFDSIPRIHVNVLKPNGSASNYMVLELDGILGRPYKILDCRDLVDKAGFLAAMSDQVVIDSEPKKGHELLKSLRFD